MYEQARYSVLVVALWHTVLNMGSATRAADGFVAVTVSVVVVAWAVVMLRGRARGRK
jgi:hypothetical protein